MIFIHRYFPSNDPMLNNVGFIYLSGAVNYFTSQVTRPLIMFHFRVEIIHFFQILCQVFDIWDGCLNQPYLSTIFPYLSACFPESRYRHYSTRASRNMGAQIHWSHLAARRDQKRENILQNTSLLIPREERTSAHKCEQQARCNWGTQVYTADLLRVIHFSTDSVNVC